MAPDSICPSLERLRRSLDLDDPMTEEERQRIEAHVNCCDQGCKQVIDGLLRGNTLLGLKGTFPVNAVVAEFAPGLDEAVPVAPGDEFVGEQLIRAGPRSVVEAGPTTAATETPGTGTDREPTPERVGRYQIVGRLGAGGMGVVYRAYDPQLGREVAIKMPNFSGSEEGRLEERQRFLREARAAAAVRHAHVCPIYDVGEEQRRPYVVMALVEGETLAERLRRQGRFEEQRQAVALIVQVADALAAVHAAHVIHRDLKPGNILLDRAGQPFLADFGLARADDSEHLTSVGQIVGTPAYMAPEQASPDLGLVGPWSDQYSLGVVLYQLLTGRLPFEGSVASVLFQIGSKTAPPPSQHRPDLDVGLERLLMKALARTAQDRYPSVGDFALALRAWAQPVTVPPARHGGAAQHRRLTLLSCGCDLFDSEALLNTLDPEEQHDLLLDFQQLCRDVIAPLAGTVVKATDHGLLICFGIPIALECATRRAVRAGLHLLDRMAPLNERLARQHKGLHLSARLAVHSDRAIVTENSGAGDALSIVGKVLPVVDQLEHLAAPDTLVISDDTHRLLRGFAECTSLGAQELKGVAGARPVYRVHRERREFLECMEVDGPRGLIPLIGRDREVALLQERWEQALEGMEQVVLLVGEAGIGKSRQVRVLKDYVAGQRIGERAARIIEWPCTSLQDAEGYRFHAIESFEALMGVAPHDGPAQKLDKLVAHLETLHLASAEAVALLASLLLIPLEDRYPPLDISPLRQKEKTFDLLLDWLRAQAHRQPVLFVVEDLHWSGPTNLEFLESLVGQAQSSRLLTLLTFRPEFVPPWKARGHHTQVSLNRLNRRQIGELMQFKSGLPTIPLRVLDQVADRTDGVPLFVEEFTAMVLEAGGLQMVDGAVQMADTFDVHAIPATLQDLLMARLDRMGSDLEVVQLAATIGREFSYELLSAVASCSAEVLQQELAKLVEAELLFQHGRPPRARYQFKHALIRDAAYHSLMKRKRQQFHLWIAEALEQRFPETCNTQPELLAHHFTEGNVTPKAVMYWERAGGRAQQRGAPIEASSHFTRALELIRALPETRERQVQEIQLHVSLGVALQATCPGGPEVEANYARAHVLCQQWGLTGQLFPVLHGLYRFQSMQAKHLPAQQMAQELLRLADREPNPAFAVTAHRALGATLFVQGNHLQASLHLETVLSTTATSEIRSALRRYELVDPWITAHGYLSLTRWLLGYPQRAAQHSSAALTLANGLGNELNVAWVLNFASWLHQFGEDLESASGSAARALTLSKEKGLPLFARWAKILSGWALAERGQSEQAVAEIRQGLTEWRAEGRLWATTYFLTLLAKACARAGRLEESLKALGEAQEFADATGEAFWIPEIHRLRAEFLLQHDPTATQDAEACLHLALEVARRQQARSLELRAAMSLGRLWDRQGKSQAARELVAPVYGAFTEGFQAFDLQTARAFLEEGPWHQT